VKALVGRLVAFIATFSTTGVVRAQDQQQDPEWPRFHVGIAVGASQLGPTLSEAGVPEAIWAGQGPEASGTAWKVVAGFRPLRVVGLEYEHVDFGEEDAEAHAGRQLGGGQVTAWEQESYMNTSAEANVLAALLFIPEASPSIDVYGKVGVAELDESLHASAVDRRVASGCLPPQPQCFFTSDSAQSDSVAYVGFGARIKPFRAAGIRVEYEAFERDGGDPTTMLSLGFAVEF
jgi:hypothetical protein